VTHVLDPGPFVRIARTANVNLAAHSLTILPKINNACEKNANVASEPLWIDFDLNRETMNVWRNLFALGDVNAQMVQPELSRTLLIAGRPIRKGDEVLAFYGKKFREKDGCKCYRINPVNCKDAPPSDT
jgi:hypothetical protein